MRSQQRIAALQRGAECRLCGRERETHARLLRALPGEEERHARHAIQAHFTTRDRSVGTRAQPAQRICGIGRHHREAVSLMETARVERARDRSDVGLRMGLKPLRLTRRELAERLGGRRGQRQNLRRPRRGDGGHLFSRRRLEDDVGVGADEAE